MMSLRLDNRFAGLRHDALASSLIVAAFVVAALFIGFVIATGRPIPIMLAVGAIAGVALLNALPLVIWIVLVGVLLVSGPVTMFVPALEKAGWLFSLLGFYLTGAAILYAAVGRERFARPPPAFVIIAMLFVVTGLLSIAYSDGPLLEGIRAIKRYYQYFGLLFVLAAVPFAAATVRRWWGFLVVLACLQFPMALYQRVVLVPAREGMPDVDPIDIVVGTMEGSLKGGGSNGALALLLITALAYLLAAYRDGALPTRRLLPLATLIALPLILGEVKMIVILIPLAFATVYSDLIRANLFKFVSRALLALALIVALGWGYLIINAKPGESVGKIVEVTIAYNFGDIGYYGFGLNRMSVYPYWLEHQHLSDPVGIVFGHGLGSSYDALSESDPGHMDQAHRGMHIGLTAASSVLWDLGIVGLLLLISMQFSAAVSALRLVRSTRPGLDRAFCKALFALASMLIVMPLYDRAPILLPSQQLLTALCLGLIAWRWRIASEKGLSAGA
ncbi:MAG: hypothetical protein AMXMBFR52_12500 [Burkholderiales bacterium]